MWHVEKALEDNDYDYTQQDIYGFQEALEEYVNYISQDKFECYAAFYETLRVYLEESEKIDKEDEEDEE